jgi:hypothetical protein
MSTRDHFKRERKVSIKRRKKRTFFDSRLSFKMTENTKEEKISLPTRSQSDDKLEEIYQRQQKPLTVVDVFDDLLGKVPQDLDINIKRPASSSSSIPEDPFDADSQIEEGFETAKSPSMSDLPIDIWGGKPRPRRRFTGTNLGLLDFLNDEKFIGPGAPRSPIIRQPSPLSR